MDERMEDGFFHGMEMETTSQILTNHADYMPRVCVCVRVRRADVGASYGRMSLMTFTSGLPPFHIRLHVKRGSVASERARVCARATRDAMRRERASAYLLLFGVRGKSVAWQLTPWRSCSSAFYVCVAAGCPTEFRMRLPGSVC